MDDLSNCFEVGDNVTSWADACEDEYDFSVDLSDVPKQVETVQKPKKQKPKNVEKVPEPVVKPQNVFSVLNDTESEDSEEEQIDTHSEMDSMAPQVEETLTQVPEPVQTEESPGDWHTVVKTKRGKKSSIREGDKIIKCKNRWCGKEFMFTIEEQEYFAEQGWPDRQKCKPCKKEQKNKEKFGGMPRVNRKKILQLD